MSTPRVGDVVEMRGLARLDEITEHGFCILEITPWGTNQVHPEPIFIEIPISALMTYGPPCPACGGKMREYDHGNKRLCDNRDALKEMHKGAMGDEVRQPDDGP